MVFNPAIDDFHVSSAKFHGREWNSMIANITQNTASPCWVSKHCYNPNIFTHWVEARLATLPNLYVFYNTVVRATSRENGSDTRARDSRIISLDLITRTYKKRP